MNNELTSFTIGKVKGKEKNDGISEDDVLISVVDYNRLSLLIAGSKFKNCLNNISEVTPGYPNDQQLNLYILYSLSSSPKNNKSRFLSYALPSFDSKLRRLYSRRLP